jgi:hypothetical protein
LQELGSHRINFQRIYISRLRKSVNKLKLLERMGGGRSVHRVLVGKPEGKNHWGDPDVDGRIILGGIFRNWEGIVGTGWSGHRIGTGGGHL